MREHAIRERFALDPLRGRQGVVAASVRFVRLVVRRPQAYTFAGEHEGAKIPGLVFLDVEGKVLAVVDLGAKTASPTAILAAMDRLSPR
jgi:hypothetical protein